MFLWPRGVKMSLYVLRNRGAVHQRISLPENISVETLIFYFHYLKLCSKIQLKNISFKNRKKKSKNI